MSKKHVGIGLVIIVIIAIIAGVYYMTHLRLPEDFPLKDRRTVAEVDHDVIQAGRNFRARVDATYGEQDWEYIEEQVTKVTYMVCDAAGQTGRSFDRSLGMTPNLAEEDYITVRDILIEELEPHGWTMWAYVPDNYSLNTFFYNPNETGSFELIQNRKTQRMSLAFYGGCYQQE